MSVSSVSFSEWVVHIGVMRTAFILLSVINSEVVMAIIFSFVPGTLICQSCPGLISLISDLFLAFLILSPGVSSQVSALMKAFYIFGLFKILLHEAQTKAC